LQPDESEDPLTIEKIADRKPHASYRSLVTIENMFLNKGNVKNDNLKTYVIWPGLLYGNGEDGLHAFFKVCVRSRACSWA
jgi:adenylate kinase